ncbi:MAG: hypothetical protein AAGA03_20530 [Planctomycetota bacterium]
MSYLFACPHCDLQTQVDPQYSGHSGTCIECGEPIRVPDFAPAQRQPDLAKSVTSSLSSFRAAPIVAALVAVIILFTLANAVVRYGGDAVQKMQLNRERVASIRNLEKIAAALNA